MVYTVILLILNRLFHQISKKKSKKKVKVKVKVKVKIKIIFTRYNCTIRYPTQNIQLI
jgi:hypothetical protein